jgi:glycosyltransferase involved in cell wall biosynthesis
LKKVLVIAYFFPPLGGSGVQRTLKFVKYLPDFGIQPIVSTVKYGHNFAYDESLLKEIPKIAKVFRSNSMETIWLRKIIEKLAGFRHLRRNEIQTPVEQGNKEQGIQGKSFKQRLFDFIDNYLFIPDSKIRWLPCGFLTSLRAAREEKVDYIFSSSYPYTVHIIALLVNKFYHKPWIADFRDPWVGNKAMVKNIAFRRKLDIWLERKIVKNAAYIINVTPPITEMYKQRYPEFAEKMITITNGFDEQDFKSLSPVHQEKFTLIYTGIITVHYDIETFVRGIADFLKEQPTARTRFQCLFIGYIPPAVIEIFVQYNIRDILVILPYMDHRECLNYLAGADMQFLTFGQDLDNAYSGKLFDYIGSGKPILALVPEGIAAQLIREKQIGTVISLGHWQEVSKGVGQYYQDWLQGQAKNLESASKCTEFSRINLAGQLTDLFSKTDS